jgi:hypothetical protein
MKTSTALQLLAAAAALALLGWAYVKSRKPGSTGGVWGTIGGLWGGASSLTQNVTDKSVATGSSLGSGVAAGARGGSNLATDILHTGGNLNPANWF